MELRDYVRILRLHIRAVLLIVGAALLVSWIVTIFSPRVYAASATGMVRLGDATGAGEMTLADSLSKSRAVSYVDVAQGTATANRVIESLNLSTTPAALLRHITVTLPADTVNLKIRAEASTPEGAQALANAWVQGLAAQVQALDDPQKTGKSMRVVPVESAMLPTSPSSPNPARNLALGLILGGALGAGYALLRSRLDQRIRDVETINREFGVTLAGAIPSSPALARADGKSLPLVVVSKRDAGSHAAEAFFKIRTNLQFMDIDNPPRVIVVTSPLPGDGKSTVAGNLAAALAEAGESVILLDGDLRRPVVAEAFGLVEGAGLTDMLTNRATFDEVAQYPDRTQNLAVVGAGSIPPNPSELLGSNAMRQLLQTLKRDHVVIIDAPPLLPVTDAAVLTANADGALVVISAGKTLINQLDGALASLEQVNGHVLGVIFNKVTSSAMGGYYGYYGYYGGYYGGSDKGSSSKSGKAPKRLADSAREPIPAPAAQPENLPKGV